MFRKNKTSTTCSVFFFIFGIILGVFSASRHDYSTYFGFDPFDNSSPGILFFFAHNIKVALLLWAGSITFGITTVLNLITNGFILGSAIKTTANQIGLKNTLLLILPHGIFEIPALVIAGVAGFKIPYELLRFALGKKNEIISEEDAKEFFKLVGISILLIFIAAIVEAKITLKIAEML
ncbi:stage II sporulation protein M [Thermococcus sp. MV5]|nr:stage II sporulation protein M [Thermococcus sp. MV5]